VGLNRKLCSLPTPVQQAEPDHAFVVVIERAGVQVTDVDPAQVVMGQHPAIMRADRDRLDRAAVALVDQHRVRWHAAFPLLAPLTQRDHRRQQVQPLVGQPVFDLAAVIDARCALEDAAFDQPGQPVGEDVARDAKLLEEFLEMVQPVERGAQDHERPSLAHRLQRLRQAATGSDLGKRFAQFGRRGLGHGHSNPLQAAIFIQNCSKANENSVSSCNSKPIYVGSDSQPKLHPPVFLPPGHC